MSASPNSLQVDVRHTLPGLELDVAFNTAGGITALFGRSGAGKTTVVNIIAGLIRPLEGQVVANNQTLFDAQKGINLPPEKRRKGYVFQEPRLFPHLNVEQNLKFGCRYTNLDEQQVEFDQAVDLLGLDKLLKRRSELLSGGEKQRVSIGRALLSGPNFLLMDEPLANLDPARRDEVLSFVESLHDVIDIPIVYVSHNMEEIIRLADTAVLIADGHVAASGAVEDVMSRLDLGPLTGRHNAGTVMAARVDGHDSAHNLTCLSVAGGKVWVSQLELGLGTELRIRVRARDVTLALDPPTRISTRNIFEGTVDEIQTASDDPEVNVLLTLGEGGQLWSRITRQALAELKLGPGTRVYALAKSVALDSRALGHRTPVTRFREI